MATPNEIIAAAQFRSDLQNTQRVLQSEWVDLYNAAVRSAWNMIAAARPDFQVTSQDFAVVSGQSASFQVPASFHSVIDVVFAPDTSQEYSLGPFNWFNRRSPGGWYWPTFVGYGSGPGATGMRLMGWLVYLEPSLKAAGSYRLWFCPKPHVAVQTVRLASTGALPTCAAAGSGVGKTLTATANAALTVDGVGVVLGDKVLIKNQAATGDNGVYTVSNPGSASTAWVLVRTPGYDTTATITGGEALNDIVAVGQSDAALAVGTLEATFWTVTTFTAMEAAQAWALGAAVEPVLEPFVEVLDLKVAIPALHRDSRAATAAPFQLRLTGPDGKSGLEGEMKSYFQITRSPGPQKAIDTDAQLFRGSGWGTYS